MVTRYSFFFVFPNIVLQPLGESNHYVVWTNCTGSRIWLDACRFQCYGSAVITSSIMWAGTAAETYNQGLRSATPIVPQTQHIIPLCQQWLVTMINSE